MTREFYPTISVACLQLHHHIIPFLPLESRLPRVYGPKLQSGVDIREGRDKTWSQCVRVLEGHSRPCGHIAFSPDGRRLVSGSYDTTVRLWDVATGALLQVMTGHCDDVFSVAYSPNGMLIASGSSDNTVIIWDAANGLQVSKYAGHLNWVVCVTFSPDGLRIASGDSGGQIRVWSTDPADTSVMVLESPNQVVSLGFIARTRLIVASRDGSIIIFELESACRIGEYSLPGDLRAFCMAPNKQLAASWSEAGDLTVWDSQTWTQQRLIRPGHPSDALWGPLLSFSPDSTHLAISSLNSTLSCEVWDCRTWNRIHELQGHAKGILGVQFSPVGFLLASASADNAIRLWDLNIAESLCHNPLITCLALSPFESIFAIKLSDGTIEVRVVESHELVCTLSGGSSDGLSQRMVI